MIYSNQGKFSFYNYLVEFDSSEGKQKQFTNDVVQYEEMIKNFPYRFSNLTSTPVVPTEQQKARLDFINSVDSPDKEVWGNEVELFVKAGCILDSFNTEFLLAVKQDYAQETSEYIAQVKDQVWTKIKVERDRRKYLGVKVGSHWFHSDDASRIQQMALAMMGNSIPAGLQWKTLTLTPLPVFVEMSPALAQGIFQATAASDAAIFAAAETHRIAMEASPNPESYDFNTGWPLSIED